MFNYLTHRWFDLPQNVLNHSTQIRLSKDLEEKKYYHYTIAAGRRSYKTERFAKRYIIQEALKHKDHKYFLGAPVRKQAKEIFWKDVKALSPLHLIRKINETDLKIEYTSGSELNVVGLKEFSTIEGGFAHGFVISEYQKCEPEVYSQSIEPMINDVGGWVIKEGRPLEKNHFFADYCAGLEHKPGHASYHWTSEGILNELQILRAKESLGTIDYNREYLASFETGGNPPYYSYSAYNHSQYCLNESLPVIVTCDFNATEKPMSWVIGQRENNNTHWTKTFSHTFTKTQTMCEIVKEYIQETIPYVRHLIFYGDYAGKQEKSNSSSSDWEIIEANFRNMGKFEKRIKPCRSIRNSIAATNAQLCNVLNERKQFVNYEQCTALVKDWEMSQWKDNGKELKENDPLRGHACRAVDYYNDYEFPIVGTTKTKVQHGFD